MLMPAAAPGEQERVSLGRGGSELMSYITHFQDFTGPPFPVLQTGGWGFGELREMLGYRKKHRYAAIRGRSELTP